LAGRARQLICEQRAESHESKRARSTSRRRLLTGAGTAAAAATVAAVAAVALTHPPSAEAASAAHAAPAADGSNLVIGQPNVGTAGTSLAITGSSFADPFFLVDASGSMWTSSRAITGISTNVSGSGVYGSNSSSGTGVYGSNSSGGVGVRGSSNTGYGVTGNSANGIGVGAYSASNIALSVEGAGRIRQQLQASAGAPASGLHYGGEMIRDNVGELWLCVQDGTPGVWVKAAHAIAGYTGGATTFLSKSIRLLDTRVGFSALNTPNAPYGGGSTHTLTVVGVTYNGVTVPSACIGAIGNLTAVSTPAGGGYLALVPHGSGFSGTAILAYGPSQTVSNSFNVVLSGGQLDIIVGGNTTDVVIDLFAVIS
jgi:hypothetical protein